MKSFTKIKILLLSLLISSFSIVKAHHHTNHEHQVEKPSKQKEEHKNSITEESIEVKEKHKTLKSKVDKNS